MTLTPIGTGRIDRSSTIRHLGRVGLLLAMITLVLPATGLSAPQRAKTAQSSDQVVSAERQLAKLSSALASQGASASRDELLDYQQALSEIRATASACVANTEDQLKRVRRELAVLAPEAPAKAEGAEDKPTEKPKPAFESPEIAAKLRELEETKAVLEARVATCRLLALKAEEQTNVATALQQALLARELTARGPDLAAVVRQNLAEPEKWWDLTTRITIMSTGWQTVGQWYHRAGLLGSALLAVVAGLALRRRLRPLAEAPEAEDEVSAGLLHALAGCGARYAPVVLGLGTVSLYLAAVTAHAGELPFFTNLVHGLLVYFVAGAGIRTLLHPCRPARTYLPLPAEVTRPLSRRILLLALVLLANWLLGEVRAEGLLDESMYLLARHVVAFFVVLNLIWIVWLLGRLERFRHRWGPRLLVTLVLPGALVAAGLGYVNLAVLLLRGVILTLLVVGLTLLLARMLSEFWDSLDEGRYRWQQALRRTIGLKRDEYIPGLGWLQLFASLGLWSAFVLVILWVWGVSDRGLAAIMRYLTEGFDLAGFRIVPSHLLWAILTFALLLTLTRWLKGRLETRWLTKTRMERGAREALVTTVGYVGVAVGIIVALSVAGVQFTNLAIIAGALSVGIGFGMQNVVNNFVSGLILLIERPVKTGDWIIVGGAEGFVRRISIRSTQLQTLDRADIIVPNSELIAGQVTNWMLHDPWGRIRLAVGVAYGSDTGKVRRILLELAMAHPDIIKGQPGVPEPKALFMAFGESSLDFELRAVIRQIDRRVDVISDLNFGIDQAFRENGIEIPFPQRDLHIKQPPDTGKPGLDEPAQ